jgi:competence protein ComEC
VGSLCLRRIPLSKSLEAGALANLVPILRLLFPLSIRISANFQPPLNVLPSHIFMTTTNSELQDAASAENRARGEERAKGEEKSNRNNPTFKNRRNPFTQKEKTFSNRDKNGISGLPHFRPWERHSPEWRPVSRLVGGFPANREIGVPGKTRTSLTQFGRWTMISALEEIERSGADMAQEARFRFRGAGFRSRASLAAGLGALLALSLLMAAQFASGEGCPSGAKAPDLIGASVSRGLKATLPGVNSGADTKPSSTAGLKPRPSRTDATSAAAETPKELQIYFVDVEGGQATLFVTPAGQSLLIDTGWPDFNGRDADRIVAAAKKAGVTKIDYVLITHFHADHVGGAPQLAERIPIGTFIDHGELRETTDAPTVMVEGAYRKLLATGKYQHIVPKPGDTLPIQGMQATVVSADAATIANPLPGGGQKNPACAGLPQYPEDKTENRRSLGTVINFGKLRIVDLGDLTHDEEAELMCPVNKLGHADIYIVSHHGWDQSSSPALVWGLAPRVAIMDNGAKKGGSPSVWDIIEKSPGLENLWQVHYSDEGGAAHNVAEEFIANPQGTDAANYLEVIAHADGSFAVFNSRTGKTKEYAAR